MAVSGEFLGKMDTILQEKTLWEQLQSETRPVVLYGMGNGAEKAFAECQRRGIPVSGVFASDAFVRGQTFLGYRVETLAQVEARFDDFVILLCFGSFLPDVMAHIDSVAGRHPLYAPDLPLFGGGIWDREYAMAHRNELAEAYSLLADDLSRKVFVHLFAYRMTGKLSYLSSCESDREEMYRLLRVGEDESYLDLGAYDGDTVRELLDYTGGQFHSVTAVEPDPKNRRKLLQKMETFAPGFSSDPRFLLIEGGVSSSDGEERFDNAAGRNSSLSENGKLQVRVYSIDSLTKGRRCTLIKMDVEGVEARALSGAVQTLRLSRPKLLFSAYHRTEDIFALPLLLHRLQPEYRICLRHQPYYPAWEVNFCAWCE